MRFFFSLRHSNVNNTSDLAKPISTATQEALDLKLDLIPRSYANGNPSNGDGTGGNSEAFHDWSSAVGQAFGGSLSESKKYLFIVGLYDNWGDSMQGGRAGQYVLACNYSGRCELFLQSSHDQGMPYLVKIGIRFESNGLYFMGKRARITSNGNTDWGNSDLNNCIRIGEVFRIRLA